MPLREVIQEFIEMELNINNNNIPVALFAFNRPKHIDQTLSALAKCNNAANYELHIFIDKGIGKNVIPNQEVFDICSEFDWPNKKFIIIRDENMGLAKNIQSGIEQVFQNHNSIIVIEDDVVVSKHFLDFMLKGLNLYQSETKVMHINGYIPNIKYKNLLGDTFFTETMYCWGWATWRDRWATFNPSAADILEKVNSSERADTFGHFGHSNFKAQLIANTQGKLNTWAIKWYSSIFLHKGVCLTPNESLVENIGIDGTGVHYKDSESDYSKDKVKTTQEEIPILKKEAVEKSLTKWIFMNFYAFGSNPSVGSSIRLFISQSRLGRLKRRIKV